MVNGLDNRVVVSLWGNPFEWHEAEYYYIAGHDRVSVTSRTTLDLLYRLLKPQRMFIAIPDTVVAAKGRGCKPGVWSDSWRPSGGYVSIVERAKSLAEDWIRKCTGIDIGQDRYLDLKVSVVPGAGSFDWMSVDTGPASPFDTSGSILFFSLASWLLSYECSQEFEIHVDLTHGINYMTTLLYAVSKVATAIYSLRCGLDVTIKIYNSEPYPRGLKGRDPPKLKIHLVESIKISRMSAAETLINILAEVLRTSPGRGSAMRVFAVQRHGGYAKPNRYIQNYIIYYEKRLRTLYSLSKESIGIYITSSPLAAIYYWYKIGRDGLRPLEELKKTYIEMLKSLDQVVNVQKTGGSSTYRVEWIVSPLLKQNLAIAASAAISEHILTTVSNANPHSFTPKDGVELEVLHRVASGLESRNKALAETELNSINSGCKGHQSVRCFIDVEHGKWPKVGNEACSRIASVELRHIYAHAGLIRGATQAKITEDGKIVLRYLPNCWESMLNKFKNIVEQYI